MSSAKCQVSNQKCQMSIRLSLLSERTSGVSPVICLKHFTESLSSQYEYDLVLIFHSFQWILFDNVILRIWKSIKTASLPTCLSDGHIWIFWLPTFFTEIMIKVKRVNFDVAFLHTYLPIWVFTFLFVLVFRAFEWLYFSFVFVFFCISLVQVFVYLHISILAFHWWICVFAYLYFCSHNLPPRMSSSG